jgi:flagellar motility protein MotE (MotC chaperone)
MSHEPADEEADFAEIARERQMVIDELATSNAALQAACDERLALIESQNEQILRLQHEVDAVAAAPDLVAELSAANAQLLAVCEERAALIETQAAAIADLSAALAESSARYASREAEIERLHQTAAERLAVIEALDGALERLPH